MLFNMREINPSVFKQKREDETWNSFLIRIFREKGGVNFVIFIETIFKNKELLRIYKEGIAMERNSSKHITCEKNNYLF